MKNALFILLVFAAGAVHSQKKEYYLGHHATSLEYSADVFGFQANYHYIINPKARFMWMPKASIGYSLIGEPSPYYNLGLDMAYGGKNRLVLGLGGIYISEINYKVITGDIRYMNFGKKHLFYFFTLRIFYDYTCDCEPISPFGLIPLFAIGWKF